MSNDQPPFRADHVGSLLRPPALLAARERFRTGTLGAAELAWFEDEAIREVVAQQERIGLLAVTDGEFRRGLWHLDFLQSFANVSTARSPVAVKFHTDRGDLERLPSALKVEGPFARTRPIFVDHFRFLKSVARAEPKLTIPSPTVLHFRGGRQAVDQVAYPFARNDARVGWLFADPVRAASDYFRRTGIFPIMHLLGVRRALVERHPWLPATLAKAFGQAKAYALAQLADTSATKVTLPFVEEQLRAARDLLGPDFWSYGVAANRTVLDTFLRHHHRQGLSPRRVSVDELFHSSTLEVHKI